MAATAGRTSGVEGCATCSSDACPPTAHRGRSGLRPQGSGRRPRGLLTDAGRGALQLLGSGHGGGYVTLLDSAAGGAVQSTLPQSTAYTSLDLTVKFLRPITVDTGKVRAIGTVISRGRQTALAPAQLVDEADRLLAHATSTCMLFPFPAP